MRFLSISIDISKENNSRKMNCFYQNKEFVPTILLFAVDFIPLTK